MFQHNAKVGLCPIWRRRKKAIWRDLLSIQNETILLITMLSKELCLFLVEENHATVKNDSSVAPRWNGNLQRRENWAAKSTKLKENAGKIKSAFVVRAALSAEKLGCYLENCRSWKNTLGKLVVVNLEAIWLNERRVNDGGEFCLLWLVILI